MVGSWADKHTYSAASRPPLQQSLLLLLFARWPFYSVLPVDICPPGPRTVGRPSQTVAECLVAVETSPGSILFHASTQISKLNSHPPGLEKTRGKTKRDWRETGVSREGETAIWRSRSWTPPLQLACFRQGRAGLPRHQPVHLSIPSSLSIPVACSLLPYHSLPRCSIIASSAERIHVARFTSPSPHPRQIASRIGSIIAYCRSLSPITTHLSTCRIARRHFWAEEPPSTALSALIH